MLVLGPEADIMGQFLGPEILGSRNWDYRSVSGSQNLTEYFIFLGLEADVICQYLWTESDIKGKRHFLDKLTDLLPLTTAC